MVDELQPASLEPQTDAALQNWQAMSPGMEAGLAKLALTSADTVLYQWDILSGQLTFSENIDDVLPAQTPLPRHIDDWCEWIDARDRADWERQSELWMECDGTYEYRYRVLLNQEPVWIKHCAMHQEESHLLVGAITFRCTPPEQNAPHLSTMRPTQPLDHNLDEKSGKTLNAGEFICKLQQFQDQHPQSQGAVVVCAITSFNIIAQAFGQSAAETVMQELEERLKNLLPASTKGYRIHQDQFGILFTDCDRAAAKNYILLVEDTIRQYGSHSSVGAVHTSSLCGFTTFRSEESNAAVIVDRAFTNLNRHPSMLQAALTKDPADSLMARQQMGLANYLSKAIEEDKLRLAYQPIIDARNGEIAHYEALLRLIDDKGRVSSAGALIPIAERMGLIDIVDLKVMEMVIRELKAYPNVKLAFNVSNLTTENADWLAHLQDLLRNHPEVAARLTVEITETAAQRDLRRTAYFVAMVQDLGCQVSLDDFGSGYTSFRQLKTLSVDTVKIDGSFIRDLTDSADNRFFVKTLLEFTELFGLKSVAEYVETGESAKLLMELGVDYLQGFYFGKPENQRSWVQDGEYDAS